MNRLNRWQRHQLWGLLGLAVLLGSLLLSCQTDEEEQEETLNPETPLTAEDLLGNPDYLAISYGGYRETSLDIQPTVEELMEDLKLLAAMDIGLLRTYKLRYPHAENVVKAIHRLKQEDPSFEMYVMLGPWIRPRQSNISP